MTEAEWLVCENAQAMRDCLRGQFNAHRKKVGRRKLQLFGCACVRDRWHLLTDPRSREAVEFVEAVADGASEAGFVVTHAAFRKAHLALQFGNAHHPKTTEEKAERKAQLQAFEDAASLISRKLPNGDSADKAMWAQAMDGDQENRPDLFARRRVLAGYLHDIFGNPFRPVTFPASWRTEHTVGLATRMYEEREFAAMPILADALEEAGCDNADILAHCREPGVHVRGCWVVDLVLGKA